MFQMKKNKLLRGVKDAVVVSSLQCDKRRGPPLKWREKPRVFHRHNKDLGTEKMSLSRCTRTDLFVGGAERQGKSEFVKPAGWNFWTASVILLLDIMHARYLPCCFPPLHGGNLGYNKAL